ncbi:signal peptidase complex subunit 3 isoform X2 [Syngnathoides biaculeatus]|uniref:signal peptidase complex subunit 3 isoform X2 n=1 Tax=Syngnathoides biaculeatus TaxID=300417 RepID=UPI002ADDEEBA|nr:signal peptidase complex subunit 3 isoform X2 [Syngnathoides biaculeatus]
MNTVLSRANSLFAFSLSVMAALTFGCFITTAFKDRTVPVDVRVSKVMLRNVDDFTGPRERSDLGFITFDLSADILYISVQYLTGMLNSSFSICLPSTPQKAITMESPAPSPRAPKMSLNQVVLWDKIVLRGENNKLNLRNTKSKYFFFDDGNGLRANKNITLTLSWNVVPNAGILPLVAGSGYTSLPFPEKYETPKSY